MLNRFERDTLKEIERQITAADPELATRLRCAKHRLPRVRRRRRRTSARALIKLLVVLTAGLLVLGLLACAVLVAAFAAVLWRLREFRITHQEW
jgi:hypothetical protein